MPLINPHNILTPYDIKKKKMSEIKWGLISQVDANCLMKTIDLIAESNTTGFINITEVGVYAGETGNAFREYVKYKNRDICLTGIDSGKDGEVIRYEYDNFIRGKSCEVYNQIPDESQDLILVDALHTKLAVISDFFAFAPKVKTGAYLCFHDTGKHINPLSGWQGVGDKNDPDMCLGGVRKALYELGLIILDGDKQWMGEFGQHFQWATGNQNECWKLIFDEADLNDEAGGICVFKKLY